MPMEQDIDRKLMARQPCKKLKVVLGFFGRARENRMRKITRVLQSVVKYFES